MKKRSSSNGNWINILFVVVTSISVVVLVIIAAMSIYLSIGGSNAETARQGFYTTDTQASQTSSSSEQLAASEEETASSSDANGQTITVLAGEGEASIADRAGISISELERLNPQHMTTGSWYANPGDVINIQ
ncbi:hypothetical protein STRDD10_00140 [Streptococcus sp. DD10]|nr:SAG1386/EF1546 family surface-associated protein [Streptococcus sp. DD10]KXT77060.1 hypothetical protein STRDD10_00140 [Streptococcus sp. DD10]